MATAKKSPKSSVNKTSQSPDATPADGLTPALRTVKSLLDAGRPEDAFHVVNGLGLRDAATQNARAVCLMRMGRPEEAVRALRGAVLKGGLILRDDVPTAYKVNFAVALALSGNPTGAVAILSEFDAEDHPQVIALRQAIQRWKRSLPFLQRLQWTLGANIESRVPVDEAPGVIA
jgi:Flp pilus assembly protein TadD